MIVPFSISNPPTVPMGFGYLFYIQRNVSY